MRGSKRASFSSAAFVGFVHPVERSGSSRIGGAHVVDQFLCLARGLGRPMLGDVELADSLAEAIVEHVDAALPAGALLGDANEVLP